MERSPEHEEALAKVEAFAPYFSEASNAFHRNAIPTRYGLKNTSDEATEAYEHAQEIMNPLLEALGAFTVETVQGIKDRIDPMEPAPADNNFTTFRVQLASEPIPEGFTGGLAQINPKHNGYGNKW